MALYIRESDKKTAEEKIVEALEHFIAVVEQENDKDSKDLELLRVRLSVYTQIFLKDFKHVVNNLSNNKN